MQMEALTVIQAGHGEGPEQGSGSRGGPRGSWILVIRKRNSPEDVVSMLGVGVREESGMAPGFWV